MNRTVSLLLVAVATALLFSGCHRWHYGGHHHGHYGHHGHHGHHDRGQHDGHHRRH